MTQTLTDAELAVLCAALALDARPFIADGPLLALSQPDLVQALEEARDGLLARNLATLVDGVGLVPAPQLGAVLRGTAESKLGFEVMCASANGVARVQFNLSARTLLVHQFLPDGVHIFSRSETEPASFMGDVVLEMARLPSLPAVPAAQQMQSFSIPHQLIHSLAAATSSPTAIRAALVQAGMDENTLQAFLSAGQQPVSQGIFTSLRLRETNQQQHVLAGTLMWFADSATCWLVLNLDEQGKATLVRSGPNELRAAVASMVERALI